MTIKIDTDQKIIVNALAEAIATFNITKVADLLSENGDYQIQDDKEERIGANKSDFLKWLSDCIDEFLFVNEDRTKLEYTIDQCLYCRIGNPVIIFENGRFPVFSRDLGDREKCGLMLEFKDNLVSDISFCFMFVKTDNPYLFEKRCLRFGY
jgi:hypothetical protein